MGIGISIILIIFAVIGYFLYRKYCSRSRENIEIKLRAWTVSALNHIIQHLDQNPNNAQQLVVQMQAPVQQQDREPVQDFTPPVDRPVVDRPLVPASRENITETGAMVYFANDRHGNDKDKEYRFNYKKVGNGWRAYILRMPGLEGRNDGSGVIHRLHDDNGYYICWDSQVNTLKDMQNISRRWADNIQEYIFTGHFG